MAIAVLLFRPYVDMLADRVQSGRMDYVTWSKCNRKLADWEAHAASLRIHELKLPT